MLARGWDFYKRIDPGISLVGNAIAVVTGLSALIAWLSIYWSWYWQTFSWAGVAIAFLAAWLLLAIGVFLIGLGIAHWRGNNQGQPRPESIDAAVNREIGTSDSLIVSTSLPSLRAGLYVSDIRFTFAELEKERHSELTMRVFNASGRVVEFSALSGHIKFHAPNSIDPIHTGVLPTPALRSDTKRRVGPLEEWFLVLAQRVPAAEADKLLAMLNDNIRILFDLSQLNIAAFAFDEENAVERIPVWDGVSYQKEHGFGRIISASTKEGAVALDGELSQAREALWKLRKEGVELRNEGKSTRLASKWTKKYDAWRAQVMARAETLSMDLRHSLDPLDKIEPKNNEQVAIPDAHHQKRVSVMSEVLDRLYAFLSREIK